MPESEDSEHLRDLEAHAAEQSQIDDEGDKAPPPASDAPATSDAPETEVGAENQMRPGGPAPGEHDTEEPTKRIDEDVTGNEETEDISDVESGDAAE